MLTISTWINNSGIILEIAGFIIILSAIRMVKPEGGSFTSKWDKLVNIMCTVHPRWNTIGIGLVIAGLGLQLASSFFP